MEPRSLEELVERLKTLHNRGYVTSISNGDQSVGKTLEYYLQVTDRHGRFLPDLRIGVELKTTKSRQTNVTLLTYEPPIRSYWGRELINMFGRDVDPDEQLDAKKSLHTTLRAGCETAGLSLSLEEDCLVIRDVDGVQIAKYPWNTFGQALKKKFQHLVVVNAGSKTVDGEVWFHYPDSMYYSGLDLDSVRSLIQDGVIVLDIRMKIEADSGVRNHGTAWRIPSDRIPELYREGASIPEIPFDSIRTPSQESLGEFNIDSGLASPPDSEQSSTNEYSNKSRQTELGD